MSAVLLVIANALFDKAFHMALIEHDHIVEQVSAAVADPAFCDSVLRL
jgi:hypothetical protein